MAGPESSVGIGLGEIATVQRPGQFVAGVHVLENVDLPGPGQSPGPSIQKAGQ